ncbi:MAG: Crp/Fnr family transcriptional regulator [Pseudomonadota bacterium]
MSAPLTDREMSVLRATSLFAQLGEREFKLIIGDPRAVSHGRGETLFYQDDPATAFFVVLEGWVSLSRDQSDGTRTVIKTVGPGESFAEAMLSPQALYPVSAEAASDVKVVAFETARFRQLIETTPELSLSIISATFQQLRLLVDQIEHLKSWSIERSLAEILLQMAKQDTGACDFKLPMDQQLIAARLSVTASTLSRTFKKLEKIGVTANRGHVVIKDVAALAAYVRGDGATHFQP